MRRFLFLGVFWSILAVSPLFAQDYVVIGWNDLGMHCSNAEFSTLVILPPYNNIHAQVIRVGDTNSLPAVMTSNLRVAYEIPGNTYSVGKTDFWDYAFDLFNVNLAPNIGLTGNGLSGDMVVDSNNFIVTGIPLTPYPDNDLTHEHPFQLGLLSLYDQSSNLLATTQPVAPVSNEINCVSSGCHSSYQGILNQHEREGGFDPNNTPILCAECHASNALGTPGIPEAPSLSLAIHGEHSEETNDCYKCHPGPNTQCLRGVMATQHGLVCQTCHGSVAQVAQSIRNGREPWLQEPSCGAVTCHGVQFAEEPGLLFRQSRGHGGLFCSACHGEPHAIAPSREANDNVQNTALQGYAGTLNRCDVCHGHMPAGPGPHGILADIDDNHDARPRNFTLSQNYPNPFNPNTTIRFGLPLDGPAELVLYDILGKKVRTLTSGYLLSGNYELAWDGTDDSGNYVASGTYLYKLQAGDYQETKQLTLLR